MNFGPDLGFLIASFPYPVAKPFRLLATESDARPERQLAHLLSASETLVQLVGSALLVDAAEQVRGGAGSPKLRNTLEELKLEKSTLGAWAQVILRLRSKVEGPFLGPLHEIPGEALQAALEVVRDERNAIAHPMRLLTPEEARARLPEVSRAFGELAKLFSFIADHALVCVEQIHRPGRGGGRLSLLLLRGSSSSFCRVRVATNATVSENDVLLIRADGKEALNLHPLFRLLGDGDAGDRLCAFHASGASGPSYYSCARPGAGPVTAPLHSADDPAAQTTTVQDYLLCRAGNAQRGPLRLPLAFGEDARDFIELGGDQWKEIVLASGDLPLTGLRHYRSGGMADVFIGRDRLGQHRVLKVLRSTGNRQREEKFHREARLLAEHEHQRLVRVYDVLPPQVIGPAIVEEFFDAPSLQEHLDQGTRFDVAEMVVILRQLLEGLSFLHDRKIVHRDIKPANLLYRRSPPELKIIDLGIAKELGGKKHETTVWGAGTQEYMAPEQLDGKPVCPETDVFAAGLVAYVLLAGSPPPRQAGAPQFDPLTLSQGLKALLSKACATDPKVRFATAREFAEEVKRVELKTDALGLAEGSLHRYGAHEGLATAFEEKLREVGLEVWRNGQISKRSRDAALKCAGTSPDPQGAVESAIERGRRARSLFRECLEDVRANGPEVAQSKLGRFVHEYPQFAKSAKAAYVAALADRAKNLPQAARRNHEEEFDIDARREFLRRLDSMESEFMERLASACVCARQMLVRKREEVGILDDASDLDSQCCEVIQKTSRDVGEALSVLRHEVTTAHEELLKERLPEGGPNGPTLVTSLGSAEDSVGGVLGTAAGLAGGAGAVGAALGLLSGPAGWVAVAASGVVGGAVAKYWNRSRRLDAVTAHHRGEVERMEREISRSVSRHISVLRKAAMTGRSQDSRQD